MVVESCDCLVEFSWTPAQAALHHQVQDLKAALQESEAQGFRDLVVLLYVLVCSCRYQEAQLVPHLGITEWNHFLESLLGSLLRSLRKASSVRAAAEVQAENGRCTFRQFPTCPHIITPLLILSLSLSLSFWVGGLLEEPPIVKSPVLTLLQA